MLLSSSRLKLILLSAALLTIPTAAFGQRRGGHSMVRTPMMMQRPVVRPAMTPTNIRHTVTPTVTTTPGMTPMRPMTNFTTPRRQRFNLRTDRRREELRRILRELRMALFDEALGVGVPFGFGGGGFVGGGGSVVSGPADASDTALPATTPNGNRGPNIFDEWYHSHVNPLTYEEQRQESLEQRFHQALNNPPLPAILSGVSLNDLATIIRQTESSTGLRGATVVLPRDAVEHINWTTGSNSSGVGMIKNGSKDLRWPATLMLARFGPQRGEVGRLVDEAVATARDRSPAGSLADQIGKRLDAMREDLRDLRFTESTQNYLDAAGYLRALADAVDGLRNPGAYRVLDERIRAGTVADLVDEMSFRGFRIGAAAPGDESYYTALYEALDGYARDLNHQTRGSARGGNGSAAGQ
jgi:hypothetical protein